MARSSRADRAAAVRQCGAGDPGVREDHDRGTDLAGDNSSNADSGALGPEAGALRSAQVADPQDRQAHPRPDADDEEIGLLELSVGDLAEPAANTAGGPVLVEPRAKATAALLHRGSVSASTPSGRSRQAGTLTAIMGDPHRSRSVIRPGWTVRPGSRWHGPHCLRQLLGRCLLDHRAGASTSLSNRAGTGVTSRAAQGLPGRERVAATTWSLNPRTAGRRPLRTPRKVITPQGTLRAIAGSRGDHRWQWQS